MDGVWPIRHSERAAFKQCPRTLYWSKVVGITRAARSNALTVGSAFHRGVDRWRLGESVKKSMEAMQNALQTVISDPSKLQDECSRLNAYLAGYVKRYSDDAKSAWKVEQTISVSGNQGTLDAWAIDKHGRAWIVDDKTRSQLTDNLHLVVQMDEQLFNYAALLYDAGLRNIYAGTIRETKKAGIKRTQKETWRDYADRVMSIYKDGPDELYRSATVIFNPDSLSSFRDMRNETNAKMREQIKVHDLKMWPWNYANCVGKYGNCVFLEACAGCGDASIYNPTDEGCLDDGKGRKKIFGYNPTTPTGNATGATPKRRDELDAILDA